MTSPSPSIQGARWWANPTGAHGHTYTRAHADTHTHVQRHIHEQHKTTCQYFDLEFSHSQQQLTTCIKTPSINRISRAKFCTSIVDLRTDSNRGVDAVLQLKT